MFAEKALKWTIILAGVLLGCYLLISWKLDGVLKTQIEDYVSKQTGFTCTINELNSNLPQGEFSCKGVMIHNPENFEEVKFIDAQMIKLHLEWGSLLRSKILLKELVFDIAQVTAVRNKEGKINLVEFAKNIKEIFSKNHDYTPPEPTRQITPKESTWFIHRFFLKIDDFTVADYNSNPTYQHTNSLDYMQIFSNINSTEPVIKEVSKELHGVVADFIIDSIIRATVDPKTYIKLLKEVFKPLDKVLDHTKNHAEDLIEKFFDPFKKK